MVRLCPIGVCDQQLENGRGVKGARLAHFTPLHNRSRWWGSQHWAPPDMPCSVPMAQLMAAMRMQAP